MISRRFIDNNHEWYPSEIVNKPPIHWPNCGSQFTGNDPDYRHNSQLFPTDLQIKQSHDLQFLPKLTAPPEIVTH